MVERGGLKDQATSSWGREDGGWGVGSGVGGDDRGLIGLVMSVVGGGEIWWIIFEKGGVEQKELIFVFLASNSYITIRSTSYNSTFDSISPPPSR